MECPENIAADIVGHKKQTMTYGLYSGGSGLKIMEKYLFEVSCWIMDRDVNALIEKFSDHYKINLAKPDFKHALWVILRVTESPSFFRSPPQKYQPHPGLDSVSLKRLYRVIPD